MIKLYRKHVNGIGTWSIEAIGSTLHIRHATVEGGSEVEHTELIETNMSGRSMEEQIALRIRSRVSRLKDKGYKESRDEALSAQTNQLGLLRPMLAQPLAKVKSPNPRNSHLQLKLDGHRCLTTLQDDYIAYSRQGKEITSISHIVDLLKSRLPQGETLDGELYRHGVPLQTIGSWIKREQPDTTRLQYVVYDIISDDLYSERYKELQSILGPIVSDPASPIKLLPIRPYTTDSEMWDFFHLGRSKGYEGLIWRLDTCGYQDGVRSNSLIKIKAFEDTEVEVIDIIPSSEGWGICVCKFNGRIFKTSAPGTKEQKREALDNKSEYIGRYITIEYSMLTNEGIPFHASAIRWREDI